MLLLLLLSAGRYGTVLLEIWPALDGIETMTGGGPADPGPPSRRPSEVNFVRGRRLGDGPGSLRTQNCIRFALIARTSNAVRGAHSLKQADDGVSDSTRTAYIAVL